MNPGAVFVIVVIASLVHATIATNYATGKKAWSSSVHSSGVVQSGPANAVDGGTAIDWTLKSCFASAAEYMPWWALDLETPRYVATVDIQLRSDLTVDFHWGLSVGLTNNAPDVVTPKLGNYYICGRTAQNPALGQLVSVNCLETGTARRYIVIQPGFPALNIVMVFCEVSVYFHYDY